MNAAGEGRLRGTMKGRKFNTSGRCYPEKHYMVNLDSRLREIKELVDNGDYLVVNRARQYGKTTTLMALAQYLKDEYAVVFMSFQEMSEGDFRDEYRFVSAFATRFLEVIHERKVEGLAMDEVTAFGKAVAETDRNMTLSGMFRHMKRLCATAYRKPVLVIDEVDSASNNRVFMDFLALLRAGYMSREDTPTFHSVILAGVYDIKTLKLKIRPEEEHRYNSPWNIAAKFKVELGFSVPDIMGMLSDYENDRHTGMDIPLIADLLYDYTSGYPYLVSCLCQMMDEWERESGGKGAGWTKESVSDAVKLLLKDKNPLFDDMVKKLYDDRELYHMLYSMLFLGKSIPYNPDSHAVNMGTMLGFIKECGGAVCVANRIFETRLYNLFLSEELLESVTYQAGAADKNQFVEDGFLNMESVLGKFTEHFTEVYGDSDVTFLEENGRRLFLLYLKPIINGVGNYYVEAQTRDMRRTDVVVDYRGRQYVVEMKIWHGKEYNQRGEKQLADYLEYYRLKKGFLLSFNFNQKKQIGVKEIHIGDKTIVEATV